MRATFRVGPFTRLARRAGVLSPLGAVLCAVCGCGGGDFARIKVPPEQQITVSADLAAGKTLKLPADKPFNVHDPLRSSTGDAQAGSDATEVGTAFCGAQGRNGGAASAEFQLGSCLYNETGKPLAATVTFSLDYEHKAESTAGATAETAGKMLLKIFIRDSVGKILKEQVLVQSASRVGPRSWSGRETQAFDVALQPDLSYHFVLAGRAEAATKPHTSASARIDVKRLEIEIACKPTG